MACLGKIAAALAPGVRQSGRPLDLSSRLADHGVGSYLGLALPGTSGRPRPQDGAESRCLGPFAREGGGTIRPKHVDAAVRDSEFSQRRRPRIHPRYGRATALLLAGAVLGATVYALVHD